MVRAACAWQRLPRRLLQRPQSFCSSCFRTPQPWSLLHLLSSFLTHNPSSFSFPPSAALRRLISLPSSRTLHSRSNGLRLPQPHDLRHGESDASDETENPDKKSRNEKKREARRSVRWGMDLSTFPRPQIKRILRVASLGREVYDAIMLVKRLGPDVKEGKRRQFNYIGKLLRKAPEPELFDAIIQASKDGDTAKLQVLAGEETWTVGQDDDEEYDTEYDDNDEVSHDYVGIANRWFNGLIDEDSSITREVYSLDHVEFDRQELRKLVRRVQSMRACQLDDTDNNDVEAALACANKSLFRFLRTHAKRTLTTEWI